MSHARRESSRWVCHSQDNDAQCIWTQESEPERKIEPYAGTDSNLLFLMPVTLRASLLFRFRLVQPPLHSFLSSICAQVDSLAPDRFRCTRKYALFAALVFLILLAILITPSPCSIAPRGKNLSLLGWQTGHLRAPSAHGSIAPLLAQPSETPLPLLCLLPAFPTSSYRGDFWGFFSQSRSQITPISVAL